MTSSQLAVEVLVEQAQGLLRRARRQVAAAVERDRDGAVPYPLADRLDVHAGDQATIAGMRVGAVGTSLSGRAWQTDQGTIRSITVTA